MATSHGSEPFVPSGPTHNKGYEPDQFGVKTILAVPAAVISTAVIAFVITWVIFGNLFDPRYDNPPADVPVAGERNAVPLNDRLARISSTDPAAEVNAPRLEGMKRTEVIYRDGDPKNTDVNNVISAQMTTTKPLAKGNPPQYHAEDLRAERSPVLTKSGPGEGGVTRITIDQAIGKLAAGGAAKTADWDYPKESNGGTGSKPAGAKATPAKAGGPEKGPPPPEVEKK